LTEKEKEVQKALGLEKGFIVRLSVKVPVYLSVPIIAKGFSEKEVRERLWKLPDDIKKQIILYICQQVIRDDLDYVDKEELGEDAIDTIKTIANTPLKNIDPKDLDDDCIDIETDVEADTMDDVMKYMKDELCIDKDDVFIV